jgi:hypothetical protein
MLLNPRGVVPGTGIPFLWDTNKGPGGRWSASFQGAVSFNGMHVAVDTSGNLWRLRPGENWTQVSASALAGTLVMLFVDSRGYVYYSTSTGAAIGNLWRFTDFFTTAGTSTATALVAFPDAANDYSCPMCEDDLGNVYTGTYHQLTAGSGARRVYKIDPQDNVIDLYRQLRWRIGRQPAHSRHLVGQVPQVAVRHARRRGHGLPDLRVGRLRRDLLDLDEQRAKHGDGVHPGHHHRVQRRRGARHPPHHRGYAAPRRRRSWRRRRSSASTRARCWAYGITTTDSSTTTGTGFAWHAHVFLVAERSSNVVMFPITTSFDGRQAAAADGVLRRRRR